MTPRTNLDAPNLKSPGLEAVGLTGGHGPLRAVDGVTLAVTPGAVTGLLGPVGAGKSTLMRLLAGLARPWEGRVRLDGQDMTGRPAHVMVARGVTLVPEDGHVFGGLSVRDNLLAGALRRTGRAAIAADLERVYDRFPRLRERHGQKAATLSGGEARMLAIGRALMARPRLLLLDEPSLALAPLAAQEVYRHIADIAEEGVGVLVADQNATRVRALAHAIHRMERGRLVDEPSTPEARAAGDSRTTPDPQTTREGTA